jgi:hypothetical protein
VRRQRDQLERQLEEANIERSELRRLLGNAQQQLGVAQQQLTEQSRILLAAPATPAIPLEDTPSSAMLSPTSKAVKGMLKDAGVKGKKARKRLAAAFSALLGR